MLKMENRNIEIFEVDSKKSKLTVTPTRVTIKLSDKITQEEKEQIKEFGLKVANTMGEVKHSWRGRFNERGILMSTDYGKKAFFNHDGSFEGNIG